MASAVNHQLPRCGPSQTFVTISAFEGGRITLPERFFVFPANPSAKATVPSLAFLITHPDASLYLGKKRSKTRPFRMLFDLGLRSDASRYPDQVQKHLSTRNPYELSPGVARSLETGGLTPNDIDAVMYSHVHYDHHGDPEDFPQSRFIVGHGALKLLREGLGGIASHQHFDPNVLPEDRTIELPPASQTNVSEKTGNINKGEELSNKCWAPLGPFPSVLDLYDEGSVYVIDTPGHLPGHVNLLCRTGQNKWILLGGDACHDTRILSGEREIGTWKNDEGQTLCIHLDKAEAEKSIQRIRQLLEVNDNVEVIIAHDHLWYENAKNGGRMFPNTL